MTSPVRLLKPGKDVVLHGQVDGRHHLVGLDPDVLTKAVGDGLAGNQGEPLAESLPHLPPPLVGQGLRAEHQDSGTLALPRTSNTPV